MQSNCNPLRSKPPERTLHTSLQRVPRRRRVSALTGYLSTASFFADLYHGGVCLRGRFGPAHISTATKPIGENAACSARAPLRDGAAGSLEQAQNSYQRGRRHLLIQATSAPGRFEPKKAAAVRSDRP